MYDLVSVVSASVSKIVLCWAQQTGGGEMLMPAVQLCLCILIGEIQSGCVLCERDELNDTKIQTMFPIWWMGISYCALLAVHGSQPNQTAPLRVSHSIPIRTPYRSMNIHTRNSNSTFLYLDTDRECYAIETLSSSFSDSIEYLFARRFGIVWRCSKRKRSICCRLYAARLNIFFGLCAIEWERSHNHIKWFTWIYLYICIFICFEIICAKRASINSCTHTHSMLYKENFPFIPWIIIIALHCIVRKSSTFVLQFILAARIR